MLHPDRFFDANPVVRNIARTLYESVRDLPLVCPHGHVDPATLASNDPFPDPTELIIIPDHYVFRMLYSQGVRLEELGLARRDGGPVESDRRKIWQLFGDHFHLFRGTPTRSWLEHEFETVFEIDKPLSGDTAMEIYDVIAAKLQQPQFRPRELFDAFKIEVLCTTDAATDSLEHHAAIRDSEWQGCVRPTFRPDSAVNFLDPGWSAEIEKLSNLGGRSIDNYASYITALEDRRRFFRSMGATATDHGVTSPNTQPLSGSEAEAVFQRALRGKASEADRDAFIAHMLSEFARMSVDDGLVMQLHPGSFRDHNTVICDAFGKDKGCDIPVATEFTKNLRPLLNRFGNEPDFTLVLFTLDESTYSRELAPLAGHYPCLRLGPPWWFQDSREGMTRFRRMATETAGICNTAGFNDDTRAFPSIPARHDLCRRVDADFLARLVAEHVVREDEAQQMIVDLSRNLVRRTYKFDQ